MVWVVAGVTAALIAPGAFVRWGPIDLRSRWVTLIAIQTVMFGMGTQMSLRDLRGVAQSPRGVLVGIVCHFSIMPLVGWTLTRIFHFPGEIAAGLILVGSCSSGLASNVMTYLAGANLALSVTVTAVTTLLAPIMTPLLMRLLAGRLVHVDFFGMMVEITEIVVVPIGAALLADSLKGASPRGRNVVGLCAAAGAAWLAFLAAGGWAWIAAGLPAAEAELASLPGFAAGAILAGIAYHLLARRWPRVSRMMPAASMAGIVYFITITTAAGRDNLLQAGVLLLAATMIHNAAGYFLGYWLSRGAGLDENSARSVAFEVGMQNAGMGSGIAAAMGKMGTVGLAPAIFGAWETVSGSILANYWRRRPTARG